MPIPDYQTLMLPVLRLAADGEISQSQCVKKLADEFELSEQERTEMLPSGRQGLLYNRIQWSRSYMKGAGLIETTRRAHFKITDRGRQVLAAHPDRVDKTVLAQFPEYVAWRRKSARPRPRGQADQQPTDADGHGEQEPALLATPLEQIEGAYLEVLGELRSEVLERVLKGTPAFFERLVVDLLVNMGYGGSRADAGRAIGQTGDGGIDGIIDEDKLGLDVIYVQAKRYDPDNTVGSAALREFVGSLVGQGANKGVFVTTSSFSKQAKAFAERRRIILIDGDELSRLLVEHDVGVRSEQTFELKRVDEDYFED